MNGLMLSLSLKPNRDLQAWIDLAAGGQVDYTNVRRVTPPTSTWVWCTGWAATSASRRRISTRPWRSTAAGCTAPTSRSSRAPGSSMCGPSFARSSSTSPTTTTPSSTGTAGARERGALRAAAVLLQGQPANRRLRWLLGQLARRRRLRPHDRQPEHLRQARLRLGSLITGFEVDRGLFTPARGCSILGQRSTVPPTHLGVAWTKS